MIKYRDACNGCCECTGCGRKDEVYPVVFCDICKHETGETFYRIDGVEYCEGCLNDAFGHNVDEVE